LVLGGSIAELPVAVPSPAVREVVYGEATGVASLGRHHLAELKPADNPNGSKSINGCPVTSLTIKIE